MRREYCVSFCRRVIFCTRAQKLDFFTRCLSKSGSFFEVFRFNQPSIKFLIGCLGDSSIFLEPLGGSAFFGIKCFFQSSSIPWRRGGSLLKYSNQQRGESFSSGESFSGALVITSAKPDRRVLADYLLLSFLGKLPLSTSMNVRKGACGFPWQENGKVPPWAWPAEGLAVTRPDFGQGGLTGPQRAGQSSKWGWGPTQKKRVWIPFLTLAPQNGWFPAGFLLTPAKQVPVTERHTQLDQWVWVWLVEGASLGHPKAKAPTQMSRAQDSVC